MVITSLSHFSHRCRMSASIHSFSNLTSQELGVKKNGIIVLINSIYFNLIAEFQNSITP